jgi:hypothetical protein
MTEGSKKILPKDIVSKWIESVLTQNYSITIHPQEYPFGEKFLRRLQQEKWSLSMIDEHKIVITSNDPIQLASLALRLRKKGYLIED